MELFAPRLPRMRSALPSSALAQTAATHRRMGLLAPISARSGLGRCLPAPEESGAFMSDRPWTRVIEHPYQKWDKTAATHSHLRPTPITIPEYSTCAIPFAWLLRPERRMRSKLTLSNEAPGDVDPPAGSRRGSSAALVRNGFSRSSSASLTPQKNRSDSSTRRRVSPSATRSGVSLVGVGRRYEDSTGQVELVARRGSKRSFPMWDRIVGTQSDPGG